MAKAKDPVLPHTLWCLQRSLWTIAQLIAPVLPATSETLLGWLGDAHPAMWPQGVNGRVFTLAPETLAIDTKPQVLFPRLDDDAQAKILRAVVGDAAAIPATAGASEPRKAEKKSDRKPEKQPEPTAGAAPGAGNGVITFDDFAKLDLRVGKVVTAQPIPKKDRVLHLTVDLGEGKPRTIVAGIASAYKPEQLVGKQVIVVANLAPRKMGELVSEGMILAAGDEAILGLSAVDADVPPGTKVR
jgi:methionyl-tRNA synthetase